jgi:hypothetical protein
VAIGHWCLVIEDCLWLRLGRTRVRLGRRLGTGALGIVHGGFFKKGGSASWKRKRARHEAALFSRTLTPGSSDTGPSRGPALPIPGFELSFTVRRQLAARRAVYHIAQRQKQANAR